MPGKASMLADASVAVRNSASRRLINSVIRVPDAAWISVILTTLRAVYASVLRANGCDGSDPGRGHYPASSRGSRLAPPRGSLDFRCASVMTPGINTAIGIGDDLLERSIDTAR